MCDAQKTTVVAPDVVSVDAAVANFLLKEEQTTTLKDFRGGEAV